MRKLDVDRQTLTLNAISLRVYDVKVLGPILGLVTGLRTEGSGVHFTDLKDLRELQGCPSTMICHSSLSVLQNSRNPFR